MSRDHGCRKAILYWCGVRNFYIREPSRDMKAMPENNSISAPVCNRQILGSGKAESIVSELETALFCDIPPWLSSRALPSVALSTGSGAVVTGSIDDTDPVSVP